MKKEFEKFRTEYKEIESFIDGSYSVSLLSGKFKIKSNISLGWADAGLSKFLSRIIIELRGAQSSVQNSKSVILEAIENAVKYGNSAIVLSSNGEYRIVSPNNGFVTTDTFGNTLFYEHIENSNGNWIDFYGNDGEIMAFNSSGDVVETGMKYYPLFHQKNFKHPYGQSRVTYPIRQTIMEATRNLVRREEGSDLYLYPQRVLNGVWQGTDIDFFEEVKKFGLGYSKLLAIPSNPDDPSEKITIDEFSPSSFESYIKIQQELACRCAALFNITPSELGVEQQVPSSAESLYASKEDLVMEIQKFTDSVKREISSFIADLSYIMDEKEPEVIFRDPSTPSKASQADAFVKMVTQLPSIKYSRKALSYFGLPEEVIDDIVDDDDDDDGDNDE